MSAWKKQSRTVCVGIRSAVYLAVMTAMVLSASPSQAQTTFDVIGPKEYDLPVDFDPFNVFVQYAYVQNNAHFWDAGGNKVAGSGSQQIVGLSKYVRFWTPNFNRNIGLAAEVIQPEIAVRDHNNPDPDLRQISGFGDTITGFAGWYKPSERSTLGIQSFLQIPWGDKDVSDTNWKNYTSLFYYTEFGGGFDFTGNTGVVFQGSRANNVSPGTIYHTNNRWGYRATNWLEPFLALDWEYIESGTNFPKSWALDGGLGLMLWLYGDNSITLRYSTSLAGVNHSYNDSWNLRFIYLW